MEKGCTKCTNINGDLVEKPDVFFGLFHFTNVNVISAWWLFLFFFALLYWFKNFISYLVFNFDYGLASGLQNKQPILTFCLSLCHIKDSFFYRFRWYFFNKAHNQQTTYILLVSFRIWNVTSDYVELNLPFKFANRWSGKLQTVGYGMAITLR